MNKIKFLALAIFSIAILASCEQGKFQKFGDRGEKIKITRNSTKGDLIKAGDYIQIFSTAKKNDSVIQSNFLYGGANMVHLDSVVIAQNKQLMDIFFTLRKGDSLTIRVKGDSIIKYNPQAKDQVKKKDFFYTCIKIHDVFKNKADADKADSLMKQRYIAINQAYEEKMRIDDSVRFEKKLNKEVVQLKDFFKKKKINPKEVSKGVYVETLKAGNGIAIADSLTRMVKYVGRLTNDTIFDKNTDKEFLLGISIVQPRTIQGFTEGVKGMTLGEKANIYIAPSKGYGSMPNDKIPANSILCFEVDVVETKTAAEAAAYENEMMKKMREEEEKKLKAQKEAEKKLGGAKSLERNKN